MYQSPLGITWSARNRLLRFNKPFDVFLHRVQPFNGRLVKLATLAAEYASARFNHDLAQAASLGKVSSSITIISGRQSYTQMVIVGQHELNKKTSVPYSILLSMRRVNFEMVNEKSQLIPMAAWRRWADDSGQPRPRRPTATGPTRRREHYR
ncbi:hypothetical protein C8R46DRAFT_1039201 [Mycena filopes]|nr:hypothetical protein C8R46DRAFT_1039201 [Mycena filopes]